jgi:hypothetical protein
MTIAFGTKGFIGFGDNKGVAGGMDCLRASIQQAVN